MSAIGPGTLLLCVRHDPLPGWRGPDLVVGRLYECLGVGPIDNESCDCNSGAYVDLVEFGNMLEWAYCPCQFVPAGHRGEFEGLLKVADAPAALERADA